MGELMHIGKYMCENGILELPPLDWRCYHSCLYHIVHVVVSVIGKPLVLYNSVPCDEGPELILPECGTNIC